MKHIPQDAVNAIRSVALDIARSLPDQVLREMADEYGRVRQMRNDYLAMREKMKRGVHTILGR